MSWKYYVRFENSLKIDHDYIKWSNDYDIIKLWTL